MKRLNIFLILMLAACRVAYAQVTFEENGILYMEDLSDPSKLAVVVIPKTSPMDQFNSLYSGSIVIPSHIEHDMDKYEVVGIAQMAFKGEKLEELIIEEGPTNVGNWAFNNSSLRKLTYPGSLKKLPNLYSPVLEELILGEGIVEINEAMDGGNLKKVVYPKSLEVINKSILNPLEGDFTLGPNIREISLSFQSYTSPNLKISGKSAKIWASFSECNALKTLDLSGIAIIDGSFDRCPILEKLSLGNVERIYNSLYWLNNLRELNIPQTCKSIIRSFHEINNLEKLNIQEGIDSIEYSFNFAEKLSSLNIPKTCKVISRSFGNLNNLEILKIEEGVESINDSFSGADNLKILYVPSSLCLDLPLRGNHLTEVHFTSPLPPKECPKYISNSKTEKLKIFVPKKAVDDYRKAWENLKNFDKLEFVKE